MTPPTLLPLLVVLALTALAVAALALERARLERRLRAIPLRVSVTGTRGKSAVTRMLAAVLREAGWSVLAKTTGSEATLILPDGSEEPVLRRGRASILEQKDAVGRAAKRGVDALVVEVMSIHPENHRVECRQLLRPHTVLTTNFRVDHVEAAGETPEAVASVLALDVPPGARVFVPETECLPSFRTAVAREGGKLMEVRSGGLLPAREGAREPDEGNAGSPTRSAADSGPAGPLEFPDNVDLVRAAARFMGLEDEVIDRGLRRTRHDVGALGIRRHRPPGSPHPTFLVSAFAANDPASTEIVHDRIPRLLGCGPEGSVGILTLRADRGDRTLQWVDALRRGFLGRFSRLYVCGRHARAVERCLRAGNGGGSIRVLPERADPVAVTDAALSELAGAGGMVFGFGNIVGLGQELVARWNAIAELWRPEMGA